MDAKDLILAIDGGGTSSQVALYDESGEYLFEVTVGSLSRKSSTENTVYESLKGVKQAIKGYEKRIAYAAFGLSGLDVKDDFDEIVRLMAKAGLCAADARPKKAAYGKTVPSKWGFQILLCSDAILPLFANGFSEGVVVISGTGSVALRISADAEIKRIGGWGYRTSDEGSGTWVGCEFIREALHASDALLSNSDKCLITSSEKNLIATAYEATRAKGSRRTSDIRKQAEAVQLWSQMNEDPKALASLARVVLESKNATCKDIRDRAESHLARLATLGLTKEAPTVVLAGGLFANDRFAMGVSKKIANMVNFDELRIIVNERLASEGAYNLARHILGRRTPKSPPASNAAVHKSMQGNKGKDTKPELLVREKLREAGIKGYRLHWTAPGKPDIAWPGKRIAILINGCFWHRHENCALASMPKSNLEYWQVKFERNVERDKENLAKLKADGWKVHVIWECELKPDKIDKTFNKLVPKLKKELENG